MKPIRFTLLAYRLVFTAVADLFHKQPPLFSTVPAPEKTENIIARFGLVGTGTFYRMRIS